MIENNYDKETYKKISIVLVFFTIAIWLYMSYITYYSFFSTFYNNSVFNEIVSRVHGSHPNSIINMGLVIVFFASALLTFSPTKTISRERKTTTAQVGFSATILFFGLAIFQYYKNLHLLGVFLNIIFFFSMFYSLLEWRKPMKDDLKQDRRNIINSQFDQSRDKLETPYSVNIPFLYTYLGAVRSSWINIVNPFRAILVGGTPGSGKSFASIEEMMRQFTKKSFAGVVYDFKFPTLTTKQYNYTNWYQQNFAIPPKFYVINFDDPEYSHRCNPINVDSLQTLADADENTKVLMLNINKTWLDKEGDFFTDSANVFTSMLMWYLKMMTEKYDYDVCSFPHLVALSTFESTEILFLILKEYNDLKPKMKPFAEALEKGALEQLAGQVSSAGIALAKITSTEINYILTGDDFSFDLNNPIAPKILCVGNNPDRQQTYSAPIGLILTKLSKTLNRQKQLPSMFTIDEFPTVYIRGIDNLIATGRSNKIATVLGFQSFAQIIADYGKEISDKILRICGTRIMGQMMDDDAEIISKNIGKQKIVTESRSYSANDISESLQTTFEDVVTPSAISQFSQGTFCGVIADNFDEKNDNKIFVGELSPPIELKKREEDLKLPKIYNFVPEDVDVQVSNFHQQYANEIAIINQRLSAQSIKQWIIQIEETTTERNFYEFFIESQQLDYNIYKNVLSKMNFKEGLNTFFSDLVNKKSPIDRLFNETELKELLNNMVYKGVCNRYKSSFLQSYNDDIYNDIYRIVAMDLIDLKIVEEIYDNKKLKPLAIQLFTKINKSDKFTDLLIKQKYEEIIYQLRN